VVVPYSTYQVVAAPFGLTLPEMVAVVGPTAVTGPVEALGADAAAAGSALTRVARARAPSAESRLIISRGVLRDSGPGIDRRPPVLRSLYKAFQTVHVSMPSIGGGHDRDHERHGFRVVELLLSDEGLPRGEGDCMAQSRLSASAAGAA